MKSSLLYLALGLEFTIIYNEWVGSSSPETNIRFPGFYIENSKIKTEQRFNETYD
jgi:hypothetical protein